MKYWLLGAVALFVATDASAQNYQLAYSPSLKLEIWIDNVQSKDVTSWCAQEVPIRIVSRESKDPHVLKSFLPQISGLMTSQCHVLSDIDWRMNDVNGNELGQGQVQKANRWAVNIAPQPAATAPVAAAVPAINSSNTPAAAPQAPAPAADATPWITFSQLGSCHFRTWWPTSGQVSSLFVPDQKEQQCQGGWLNGPGKMAYGEKGGSVSVAVNFINGFPVAGLKRIDSALHIVTANNQRVVLSNDKSADSWLILPSISTNDSTNSSATANGMIALQMTPQQATDSDVLQARVNDVRKDWAKYLNSNSLSIGLVPSIAPQLKDPAAGAFRILN